MKVIKFNNNLEKIVEEAVKVLQNGGIIIYPTETAYGVGVDASNSEAVSKLLEYKDRPEGKAISVAVSSREMAENYVQISQNAENIYQNFLPGPVTAVSKSKGCVDKRLESEDGKLGIRYPDHQVPIAIIEEFGHPITATSANTAGKKTPYQIEDIVENISSQKKEFIDLIIDFGRLPGNPPSTVIDTTLSDMNIIREGSFDFSQNMREYVSNNEKETLDLAIQLIDANFQYLREYGLMFLLDGDLGAGKTQFTIGLGKALDVNDIDSPTFTIINESDLTPRGFKGKFVHIDTWRIERLADFKLLKVEDYLKPGNIIVVEWWSKFQNYFEELINKTKVKTIKILIEQEGDCRKLKIQNV